MQQNDVTPDPKKQTVGWENDWKTQSLEELQRINRELKAKCEGLEAELALIKSERSILKGELDLWRQKFDP